MTVPPRPLSAEAYRLFERASSADSPGPEDLRRLDQRMAQLLSATALLTGSNEFARLAGSRRGPSQQPTLMEPRARVSEALLQKKALAAAAAIAAGMFAGAFWLGRTTSERAAVNPAAADSVAVVQEAAAPLQQPPAGAAPELSPRQAGARPRVIADAQPPQAAPSADSLAPGAPRTAITPGAFAIRQGASPDVSKVHSAHSHRGSAGTASTASSELPRPNATQAPSTTAADDLALLAEVERALREGRAEEALSKLARSVSPAFEHHARALRSLGLCQSGRTSLGREQARQVLARWPRSVFGPRLTTVCGL